MQIWIHKANVIELDWLYLLFLLLYILYIYVCFFLKL